MNHYEIPTTGLEKVYLDKQTLEIAHGISAPGTQRILKMCIGLMQSIGCCYDKSFPLLRLSSSLRGREHTLRKLPFTQILFLIKCISYRMQDV